MTRAAFYLDVAKLENGELADLIHELNNELDKRCRNMPGNRLKSELDSAALTVRSWSTNKQRTMKGVL